MKILDFDFTPKKLIANPSDAELREMCLRQDGKITQFGNIAVISRVRNRSAKFTEVIWDKLDADDRETLTEAFRAIEEKTIIQLDKTMCTDKRFKKACRLYVDAKFARLPLMWGSTLFAGEDGEPDFITIALPDWRERRVYVFPDRGITIVLGSDYKGEIKKSMLRQIMYTVKQQNCLGLHAGSKILRIRKGGDGADARRLHDVGFLFFGLSGTGKTSLSCHHHWLRWPEGVVIRQDDVVILEPTGRAAGTEACYYIKTEGLRPDDQPLLYAAAISPRAILENVQVSGENNVVNFDDASLTSNGRAMVNRHDIAFTDGSVDLDAVHNLVFITRHFHIVPPVMKLSPEWGAAAFMLGESVETSAGDPTQAGKSKRVVGTNPFIVGSEADEGNIFLDILRKNPGMQCYLLNTGWVGGEHRGVKISVKDSARIIEMIARGTITWKPDEFWGFEVPEEVPGLDMSRFDPRNFYAQDEIDRASRELRDERRQWVAGFKDLDQSVVNVFAK
ncbi:MAG: phosphoenolpyruvate carboxykinase [Verrucomicrobia bacterium]|nr:phosphoenolpyruvate carboxykinase [Verrucomicrobiota bacterium]